MKKLSLVLITILLVGGSYAANTSAKPQIDTHPVEADAVVYKICNDRIEIKPRLKYELAISLDVLKSAEDHHQLLVPWAQQMRKDLTEKTLHDAMALIENTHEWQLSSLVQNYNSPDTIEGIANFIKTDSDKAIAKWASMNSRITKVLGLTSDQFPAWYADFLKRYYDEAFGKQWLSEHRKLVYEDANSMAKEMESDQFSPTAFMEKITGRKFSGSTKLILYPSSFSRPCHGYGFSENGNLVTVYQVGTGKTGVLGTVFHELLHTLIRDWWQAERMKAPISELAKESLFKNSWEQKGKRAYPYPDRWLDEIVVHAIGSYMEYKAGFITERQARQNCYNSYESALYEVIFDRYDSFNNIDDFIFYAINHIKIVDADFAYVDDSGKPRLSQFVGPINAVILAPGALVLIIPTKETDQAVQDKIRAYAETVREMVSKRFPRNVSVLTDAEALKCDLSGNSIFTYGTTTGNLWLAKYFAQLPVRITSKEIVADVNYPGTDLRFITAWPNPQNPQKGVTIYTAQRAEDIIGINNVFHGPTDYVIARGVDVLKSGDYKKQNVPWTLK